MFGVNRTSNISSCVNDQQLKSQCFGSIKWVEIPIQITDLDKKRDFVIRQMEIHDSFTLFGKQRYVVRVFSFVFFYFKQLMNH